MKILLEISHPAHVHYFRNFIENMSNNGYKFQIIAREKDVTFDLLKLNNISFINFGKTRNTFIGKALGVFIDDIKLLWYALNFKPDYYLSFSSPFVGHIAFLMNKPHIVFDDTEFAKIEHLMYKPFASSIVTPTIFGKDMGKKHIKIDSFFELCYLYPKYFKPDPNILKDLGIRKGEKFVIMRFVAYKAVHDLGVTGFTLENKIRAVREISKFAKVFISSEKKLDKELEPYRFNIPFNKLHDALYYASLYLGDSQTTSTEAACLGTPSVRCSAFACTSEERANFIELKKYNLIENFNISNQEQAINKAIEMIQDNSLKQKWQAKRNDFLSKKVDMTSFMTWFMMKYPKSVNEIKNNPRKTDF